MTGHHLSIYKQQGRTALRQTYEDIYQTFYKSNLFPPVGFLTSVVLIRSWSASVLVPGHDGSLDMLVIGGVDQNNVTVDTIEKINVASRQSRTMNLTMSQPLSGHCAVQVNSTHTFIAGGSASGLAGLAGQTDISNRSWYLTEDEMIPAEDMIQV